MDEVDLVRRARAGDREAFGSLIAGQLDRLYATAYLVIRAPEPARDATQEALLDAWRGLPGLRDPRRFGPWLHRLLLRRCLRHRTDRHRDGQLVEWSTVAGMDASGLVADRDELERGFRQLTIEQRTVIVLRFYLDMSVEQVAEALDLPTGTVKSRSARALEAMRAALAAGRRAPAVVVGSEQ